MITVNPQKVAALQNAEADRNRRAAYAAEADPLAFKVLRGEIERQVWLDKIAEIKARHPKV